MEYIYGLVGLILGVGVCLLYTFLLGRGAKAKAQLILDEAQRDADSKIKDAEVSMKELQLKQEADAERKLSKSKEKIHQRERALDKRDAALSQQTEDLKKQEQFIETTQNRLKVKLEQVTQAEKDLTEIFEKQRKDALQKRLKKGGGFPGNVTIDRTWAKGQYRGNGFAVFIQLTT